ncbi:hypothetical protein I4000191A8_19380 [Clostridia bacterium i40-0019-1A8]
METSGGTAEVPPPRVGLEERGTPMLDARKARRSGGKASSNAETYISRDGEGRAYTQARASE